MKHPKMIRPAARKGIDRVRSSIRESQTVLQTERQASRKSELRRSLNQEERASRIGGSAGFAVLLHRCSGGTGRVIPANSAEKVCGLLRINRSQNRSFSQPACSASFCREFLSWLSEHDCRLIRAQISSSQKEAGSAVTVFERQAEQSGLRATKRQSISMRTSDRSNQVKGTSLV